MSENIVTNISSKLVLAHFPPKLHSKLKGVVMYVQAFECKAFSTVYWTDEKVSVYYVASVKLQGPSQRWEYL